MAAKHRSGTLHRKLAACWLACIAIGAVPQFARAWVVEDRIKVPVKVATTAGDAVGRDITVALFHENSSPEPRPLLVLNHGRSYKPAERARVSAKDLDSAARWLTGFGFIVAVPVRVGYGVTGGADVEDSGACRSKNYPPVYLASAVQTLAVLEALRKRPDAAKDRAVVMGQSFGGTTAITVAALDPKGIQGAINFAGGGGGNPELQPQNPCGQAALKNLFSGYGKTARIPTLWIYSENDQYFGPKLPREWFAAFKASGGRGEYVPFPPFGDNGHQLFSRGPQVWQPKVQAFLGTLGYAPAGGAPGRK